ncbi:winged helix DNA-binding domain-containing protein [Actinokineospora sp. HUAS TT18]|uniref:winged helix DNA-binding domain-containing protein n=1 Tax=Actinokineospora sp. HUAS TT18 TaxID=3447451 RepID=UPI003F51D0D6
MSDSERRARLSLRHGLAAPLPSTDPADAADAMLALHATDPCTVYLSVLARMAVDTAAVSASLYDERSVVRLLGMRRTVFVVGREVAPVVQAACTRAVAAVERRRLVKHLEELTPVTDAGPWLADVEASTFAALTARGEATAAELAADEPRLRTALIVAEGKPYAAKQNITSRVLGLLAADGKIVRGRPLGSWTSTQYRWSPMTSVYPDGIPDLDPAAARAELARRWLRVFGPAPVTDLKWWAGWTLGDTRKALAEIGAVEVDLDSGKGVILADDLDPVAPRPPRPVLLPALDPTPMGWSDRRWFLGDHGPALFDRSGNIGPTVFWDGHIVGGWAHRPTGEIAVRLLEDIGSEGVAAVATEAERLATLIGDVRVKSRFATPLEKELVAG